MQLPPTGHGPPVACPASDYTARMMRWSFVLLLSASLACGSVGCVQRTVTVTSEPTGALVWLNDREVGRTPVTVPFTFYGTYDVRLERDGYEPLWTSQEAKAPWWETPPIDLFAEATDADVELAWHFELEPAQATDDESVDALLEHATQMRRAVEAGEDFDTDE